MIFPGIQEKKKKDGFYFIGIAIQRKNSPRQKKVHKEFSQIVSRYHYDR